jgi:hypothetical protein
MKPSAMVLKCGAFLAMLVYSSSFVHAWTDYFDRNDGVSPNWEYNTNNGGTWWDNKNVAYYAIINITNPDKKGRAEILQNIFTMNGATGASKSFTVEGEYIFAASADSNGRYGPSNLQYLVYDYVWNASTQDWEAASGFPVRRTISTANGSNQRFTVRLDINYRKDSGGSVRAYYNGTAVTSANYDGRTYPSGFPSAGIHWKAGCYSATYGTWHSKVGLVRLYTNAIP